MKRPCCRGALLGAAFGLAALTAWPTALARSPDPGSTPLPGYRSFTALAPGDWGKANEHALQRGGWKAYARQSAAHAAHAEHGGGLAQDGGAPLQPPARPASSGHDHAGPRPHTPEAP